MKQLILLSCLALTLGSCAKNLVPFTQNLRDSHRLGENEIRRIQFYTSDDIAIHRKLRSGETEIVEGSIKIIDGREVEEVIIPEGTKGVAVLFADKDKIGISFEKDDDHFLMFGPHLEKDKRYVLKVADITDNKVGMVTYDGRKYELSRTSAQAFLLVDMKRIKKWDVDQRVAKGRTIE